MFTQLSINVRRKLKKSFVGSLVFAIAVFIGFANHSSDDPYTTTNSVIKTAHAGTVGDSSGGSGGGCAGCGGASGGCSGSSSGDSGM